jgi:glycosyltransferase involved in cell wall biosynthesis
VKKRIAVSVISDLNFDQRVHKVCTYLTNNNFHVLLIGRNHKQSLPIDNRNYKTERIRCYFNKGALLYSEFMVKLFFKLLFKRTDIFLSNDLDTLLPNFLISKLRGKKLVYDSHEYFTGVPELQSSHLKRKVWQGLEKLMLPNIKHAYTVNQSIADLYYSKYSIKMRVVRNMPYLRGEAISKTKYYPENKTVLLLQGTGINEGRGAEELIQSMQLLPNQFMLFLIGSGDCWNKLKKIAADLNLNDKVKFIDKIPFSELRDYTSQAHLGISLDKPFCLNYKLSLPNKIFDYIHAGIPVLSSDVIEVKRIIDCYKVGLTISEVSPSSIAKAVTEIFHNKNRYMFWKQNTQEAAKDLCWEKEEKILDEIFNSF